MRSVNSLSSLQEAELQISHPTNAKEGGAAAHRRGGLHFRYLLEGEEGAKDNYSLFLVEFTEDYATPRHRHNFEQIRIMLEGAFSFAPGRVQEEGSVGYFCEGGYYTQQGVGDARMLLLQVAGPSGEGYMSHDALRKGGDELAKGGRFDDGVYIWKDDGGKTHKADGYEAVWEHVHGRPISYTEPRYADPVILNPSAFSYLPHPSCPGIEERSLGRFHERGLEVRQRRMARGSACSFAAGERGWLFFALSGEGRAGNEPWGAESAFALAPGEAVEISCSEDSEFYMFGLPAFGEAEGGLPEKSGA
jgi:hypothetical protein